MMFSHQFLVRRHQEATHPTWNEDVGVGGVSTEAGGAGLGRLARLCPLKATMWDMPEAWGKPLRLVIRRDQGLPQPPQRHHP